MTDKVRTIRLYGKLGTRFGRVHRFVANSTKEAVRALCVMVPGFEQELLSSADKGVGYSVFLGKTNIGEDSLDSPVGNEDIRIAPMIVGSKRGGIFQIVLGAALVLLAPFTGGASLYVAAAGWSSIIGGAIQLITPQQKGVKTKDGPNNGASYNFNGPVNTTVQGNAVPILYGRHLVGGATISASIYSEDQA